MGWPSSTKFFCFLYPCSITALLSEKQKSIESADPDVALLWAGGFVFYDRSMNCLGSISVGLQESQYCVEFNSRPETLHEDDVQCLLYAGRWAPVTINALKQAGALYFAYILPNEQLATRKFPAYGSFAYLFRQPQHFPDPRDRFFIIE